MFDLSQNHFQLFGLPVSFALDSEVLAERYRTLRQTVHPDLFATAGEREKRLALQASTLVNEAYQTLKDPLARARYLLQVRGAGAGDDQKTTQDMAFLMEQMELREALALARQAPEPYAAIERVRARLSSQADELIADLGARLDTDVRNIGAQDHGARSVGYAQGAATDPQPWSPLAAADTATILELIRKLQFVRKCEVEAEALEAELDEAL